jgi:hypothetical protein
VIQGKLSAQRTVPEVQSKSSLVAVPEGSPDEILLTPDAQLTSHWNWGTLVGVESNESSETLIYRMTGPGEPERVRCSIPDAGYIFIREIAGGPDRSIAICGQAFGNDGKRASFIARISPDLKSQVLIRTWPYIADVIAIAADGTIWTAGWIAGIDDGSQTQFNFIRRFSQAGGMLSSNKMDARGPANVPHNATSLSILKASKERVGWLTKANDYFEFSLDGTEIGRYLAPEFSTKLNITSVRLVLGEQNDVLVSGMDEGFKLWKLDRAHRRWEQIELASSRSTWTEILGFDGQDLLLKQYLPARQTKRQRVRITPRVGDRTQ